jgi:hypothetical protein
MKIRYGQVKILRVLWILMIYVFSPLIIVVCAVKSVHLGTPWLLVLGSLPIMFFLGMFQGTYLHYLTGSPIKLFAFFAWGLFLYPFTRAWLSPMARLLWYSAMSYTQVMGMQLSLWVWCPRWVLKIVQYLSKPQ